MEKIVKGQLKASPFRYVLIRIAGVEVVEASNVILMSSTLAY